VFFTLDDVVRFSRLFRRLPCEVSEELRGWNWSEYPLVPPYGVRLSVGEVAGGFCPTDRVVYLRRVLGVRERRSLPLSIGSYVHRVCYEVVKEAKRVIYGYEDVDGYRFHRLFSGRRVGVLERLLVEYGDLPRELAEGVMGALWNYAANTYASALDRLRTRSPYLSLDGLASMVVPMAVEYPIDGTLIGLYRTLRVDALLQPNVLVELKVRSTRPEHEVGLAAYALAFESQYEVPVNYALMVNIRFDNEWRSFKSYEKVVPISDELRQRFIERRDAVMRIVAEEVDPGVPDRCNPFCPYLEECRGRAS